MIAAECVAAIIITGVQASLRWAGSPPYGLGKQSSCVAAINPESTRISQNLSVWVGEPSLGSFACLGGTAGATKKDRRHAGAWRSMMRAFELQSSGRQHPLRCCRPGIACLAAQFLTAFDSTRPGRINAHASPKKRLPKARCWHRMPQAQHLFER